MSIDNYYATPAQLGMLESYWLSLEHIKRYCKRTLIGDELSEEDLKGLGELEKMVDSKIFEDWESGNTHIHISLSMSVKPNILAELINIYDKGPVRVTIFVSNECLNLHMHFTEDDVRNAE